MFGDLKNILVEYDNYVESKGANLEAGIDDRPLALVGTWKSLIDSSEEVKRKIDNQGGWACW